MAATCSWPAPEKTNKPGIPPGSVHGSRSSGTSLEDDLVQDSVGASGILVEKSTISSKGLKNVDAHKMVGMSGPGIAAGSYGLSNTDRNQH
jgi:hypothetical protein